MLRPALLLLALLAPPRMDAQTPPRAVPAPLTIVVEVRVQDARGRPVTRLGAADVELRQEGVVQRDVTFRVLPTPGLHELSYAPSTGRAGALTLRPLRPGLTIGAPDGKALRPRIVVGPSALEAELGARLDAPGADAALPTRAAALVFERTPQGARVVAAVEVPLGALRLTREGGLESARVQFLARIKDEAGRELARVSGDRLVAASGTRLVWTGVLTVPGGRHTLETIARDAAGGQAGVQRVPVEVPLAGAGPRLSSVTLLQPSGSQRLLTDADQADDPLFFDGVALMPALDLRLPVQTAVPLQFFVVLYPDSGDTAPPALRAELWRDGRKLGQVDLKLPPPDERGFRRYSGQMPTHTFVAAEYTLRLVATQGATETSSTAAFRMIVAEPPAPVRLPPP